MKRWLSATTRGQSELLDIGAGLAAGLAVVVVSLVQWGMTDAGWMRGLTLGAGLGVVVAFSVRRGRVRAAERERAESERQLQLARELHDAVATQVGIVGIQAAAARRVLASDPARAAAALEAIELAARAANGDLRRMLATLRAGAPNNAPPGIGQLEGLADEYRAHGLDLELDTKELTDPVPLGLGAVAYRVVQEALANVVTHAGRVRTVARVTSSDGELRVTVENDAGREATANRGSGLGLKGIGERAELFGGTMEAGLRSDGGFVVDVRIPTSG